MKLFLLILAVVLPVTVRSAPAGLDEAVDTLDFRISQRQCYLQHRANRIDSLKSMLDRTTPGTRVSLLKSVADNYRPMNIDSAICYYDLAMQGVRDKNSIEYKRIAWAKSSIMPVSGLFREGCELFLGNRPDGKDTASLRDYYSNGVDMYLYIYDFHIIPYYRKLYGRKAMELNDSLLNLLPEGTDDYRFHKAYQYFYHRQEALAVGELKELLGRLNPDDNRYARIHAILAHYYMIHGHDQEARYHFALAAAGDIQTATQELTALTKLGISLYETGDVDRAYRYLTLALESSVAGGCRLRTLENAEILPIISKSFRQRDKVRTRWLIATTAVLTLALAIIIAMMVIMRRKQRNFRELQYQLKDNMKLKDVYIGQVLTMCSLYIERMEEFNRLAGRKIKTGQVQDLYRMIESGKILQEQATQFYDVFDKAFFGIYPDFVVQVNLLLQPDKQIVLPVPGRLTPECRILAFMRLGINDSNQLSKFLGLSLNTIYTYRNKLKSRAVRRDTFEDDVRKIGQLS